MINIIQWLEMNAARRNAEAVIAAKASGENDIEETYVYGKMNFCGSKKQLKELLISPEEIIQMKDKGLIKMGVASISYAIYCYFNKRLTYNEKELLIAYGMLFEAGRLQGIREERQKRKKRSQQNMKG